MDPSASDRISKYPSLAAPERGMGGRGPIAPMEECLARARDDWGHDPDKMQALTKVIESFHRARLLRGSGSFFNNRCVSAIRRMCRARLEELARGELRPYARMPLAEEILALRYCSPDGTLDATIAGHLCGLGLIELAQVESRGGCDHKIAPERTNETSAAPPDADTSQRPPTAELMDMIQGLTARMNALEKTKQQLTMGDGAVVTANDLRDAMREVLDRINSATKESEAAMDAKWASAA